MIKSNCEFCGKETEFKYKSQVKRYCSYECSNSAKWQTREKGETEKIICKVCGKEFSLLSSVKKAREKKGVEVQYCSVECMGVGARTRKTITCKNCGKEFETTRATFCSAKCSSEFRKKSGTMKKNGFWYENGYKVLYLDGDKSIKEHIKVIQDFIGRKLKKSEVVHHINEDKLDNRIDNLQLMTRGEHSKLHRAKEREKRN